MPRCPVCESIRIVVIVSPKRRAFCPECGSRWRQDGSHQWNVQRTDYLGRRDGTSAGVSRQAFRQ
jgi:uncharacterized paraquat-inducible protein A